MKKIVALLFLVALCISLCACGQSAQPVQEEPSPAQLEPSKGDLMYEKYGSIIDKLEMEDYQAAIDEISAMLPEPEITEVTITPENFLDYYEIEYWPAGGEKDATGMWTSLSIDLSSFYFKLKDQYIDNLKEDSHCEVGVIGNHNLKRLESVDWSTGQYVLSAESYGDIKQAVWEEFKSYGNPETFPETFSVTADGAENIYIYPNDYLGGGALWRHFGGWTFDRLTPDVMNNEIYVSVIGDMEIVRAEGTLFLNN